MNSLLNLVISIQGWGSSWTGIMRFFSFLGTEEFFLLVLPALYWNLDASLGLRVGVILLSSGALNSLLKMFFHMPRPYWVSEKVIPMAGETSFGIPSGHAQVSVGVWGMVAAWVRRWWATVAAVLLVFCIGLSRIYLGVHFPQDVVAGWLLGVLLLAGFLMLERPFLAAFRRLSTGWQLFSIWLFSVALIALGAFARAQAFELPPEWIRLATRRGLEPPQPWALHGVINPAAALFGLVSGAIWIRNRGGLTPSGIWWQRVLHYGIGIFGIMLLWMGLGALFPRGETLFAFSLRYLRYALIGFWVSGLAPYLFQGHFRSPAKPS
uniref:Phosphoesterase, PA-phosphatase related n=1 Tax=uncultured Chloroflexota bacterium TaxID=166587 RepID=H5SK98_9CHLR|nr:PA-phosphatase related phosphoesterase [uncultured bacterium]BAL56584.1 phosphoesterase, PA-phosphatase related [uncultured Chloroflexota bacterium]